MRFYKKGTAESCRPVLPSLSINYFCQKCNAQAALSSTSASISSAAAAACLVLYGDENARLNVPENFSPEERAEAAEDMLADVLESAA